MALDVYFRSDLAHSIQAACCFAARMYVAQGGHNPEYIRGIFDMAEQQSRQYGLYWPDMLENVKRSLSVNIWTVLEPALQVPELEARIG